MDDLHQTSIYICCNQKLSWDGAAYVILVKQGEPLESRTCILAGPWVRIHQIWKIIDLWSIMIKVGEIGDNDDVARSLEFLELENDKSLECK